MVVRNPGSGLAALARTRRAAPRALVAAHRPVIVLGAGSKLIWGVLERAFGETRSGLRRAPLGCDPTAAALAASDGRGAATLRLRAPVPRHR